MNEAPEQDRFRQAAIESAWRSLRADAQSAMGLRAIQLLLIPVAISAYIYGYNFNSHSATTYVAGTVTFTLMAVLITTGLVAMFRDKLKPMDVTEAKQLLADAAIEAAIEAGRVTRTTDPEA